jgi:hypothetical protein
MRELNFISLRENKIQRRGSEEALPKKNTLTTAGYITFIFCSYHTDREQSQQEDETAKLLVTITARVFGITTNKEGSRNQIVILIQGVSCNLLFTRKQ